MGQPAFNVASGHGGASWQVAASLGCPGRTAIQMASRSCSTSSTACCASPWVATSRPGIGCCILNGGHCQET
eukprot:11090146-Alexandrium_andersonii.AAC.1